MSREQWNTIKRSSGFYVNGFRIGVLLLLCTLFLNIFFAVAIALRYLSEPEPEYYATNGVTALVQLTALMEPNKSSVALLEPDPPTGEQEKKTPQ